MLAFRTDPLRIGFFQPFREELEKCWPESISTKSSSLRCEGGANIKMVLIIVITILRSASFSKQYKLKSHLSYEYERSGKIINGMNHELNL